MTPHAKSLFFTGMALVFVLSPAAPWAQPVPVPAGSGTNFASVLYYEPPHEQQVKVRLSGAEMSPLPGMGLYDVKKLRIENYGTNGMLMAVAEAPQCTYAPLDEMASSPGHLDLTYRGDKLHMQGEGFLWQQNRQSLVISNKQQTLIKMENWTSTNLWIR